MSNKKNRLVRKIITKQIQSLSTDDKFKEFIKKESKKFVISLILNGVQAAIILYLIWVIFKGQI